MSSDADVSADADSEWPPTPERGDEDGELRPGTVLDGRYRIEGHLGSGGIGVVYRAVQLPLERPVAVKVLHDDLASLPDQRTRFEREARALSALTHPHVVGISDYGVAEERPFLAMELLEGETLDVVLKRGRLDPARALDFAKQLLRGLAFAHQKGIAHRDLKPANVFLTELPGGAEHLKLLDFGLARMVTPDAVEEEPTLTARGVVFGTPAYMSPEQAAGSPADERSDVYSAGVLMFELLAGRRPFVGATRADLLRAHLGETPPDVRSVREDLGVHDDLRGVLDTAMDKDPDRRFAHAEAMLAALDAIPSPVAWRDASLSRSDAPTLPAASVERPERRRGGWAAGLATLALVAGIAGAWWWSSRPAPTPPPVRIELPDPVTAAATLPPDPFVEPPPEPLRPFLQLAEEGHVFDERAELGALYALAREMEFDPRPMLLIGRLFVLKGWYTEGIARYRLAHQRDPASRGHRPMLADLTRLSGRSSVEGDASEAVVTIYGREALPAVEEAIDEAAERPLDQLRLVRLRERLQALPREE
ncbi:MAG: serine/threonine-protein kinase [Sandaracinaceae bacterium]